MPYQIREAFRRGDMRSLQVDRIVLATWVLGIALASAAMLGAGVETRTSEPVAPQVTSAIAGPRTVDDP